jgi:hypothetical protein
MVRLEVIDPMTQSKTTTTTQALKKADRRVKDSARWLLEFAKIEDLAKLTTKESTDLAAELIAVAKREADDYLKTGVFDTFLKSTDVVKGSMMGSFHNWLKEQFRQVANGNGWNLYDPNLMPTRTIDLFNIRASRGDTFAIGSLGVFAIAANRIVERERERFGICQNPRCKQTFVAKRKNRGKYCKAACASYVNVMKWQRSKKGRA